MLVVIRIVQLLPAEEMSDSVAAGSRYSLAAHWYLACYQ